MRSSSRNSLRVPPFRPLRLTPFFLPHFAGRVTVPMVIGRG